MGAGGGGGAGGGVGGGVGGGSGANDAGSSSIDPIADAGPAVLVDGGFQFTEGPQWIPSRGELLFSDIPANRIYRHVPPGTFTVFRQPSGNANGIALAPNGDLIVCEHGNRRVSRTLADGGVVPVAETFDGGQLNSPNDAVVRSDGTIYFTDPTYGLAGRPAQIPFRGLYRVATDGGLYLVYSTTTGQPNGVVLSPDERVLYMADSQLNEVRRFDVAPDGTTSNGARFTLTSVGPAGGQGGDGIAVDDDGNLYVTTTVGVKVFRPDAGYIGLIQVPEQPANCAFGDADRKTLYITARSGLYKVRVNVPGPP